MGSLNPAPPPLLGFSLPGIVGLWVFSTCLEVLVWAWVFKSRLGDAWWRFIFGWMAIIQALSTMLSAGLAVLLFEFLGIFNLSLSRFVPTDQTLYGATAFWTNPVGVTLAFLLCPILLETAWWRASWLVREHQVAVSKAGTNTNLSLGTLLAGASLANLFSWGAGFLFATPLVVVWNDIWWAGGWLLCIPLILAAAWSITFPSRQKKAVP
jgi:hypothetical protein